MDHQHEAPRQAHCNVSGWLEIPLLHQVFATQEEALELAGESFNNHNIDEIEMVIHKRSGETIIVKVRSEFIVNWCKVEYEGEEF